MNLRVAFSKRSWPYMLAIALPWLIQQTQRTVRNLTHGAGLAVHESNFYRFFSEFKFKVELLPRILFDMIVSAFKLQEILIVVDDTLCPKWGHHIFGTGSFFDHVARPRPGFIWGHNWVVLAVIVELFRVPVALPFWVKLYRPKSSCPPKEFRTRLQLAEEAIRAVKTWTSLPVTVVADGAYNNDSLLSPLGEVGVPLVSRIRHDARLRKDPPKSRRGKRGRRPKYGAWLPRLPKLARNAGGWQKLVVHIYGKEVTVKVKTFDAWWPKAGVKLRVVIVRDPEGKRKPCYLSSTDLNMSPKVIIETFSKRWSIEQMFSDAKNELGLDTAEVRSPASVVRHAALAFGFVTMVRLWAFNRLSRKKQPPTSFRRQLSFLREEVIIETILASQAPKPGSRRNAEALAGLLTPKIPA
jgi:SRSO17 transposase